MSEPTESAVGHGESVQIHQRVVPSLAYDDAPAAIEFLCRAFGFEERFRYAMPDGSIGHAELLHEDNVITLATTFAPMGFASPSGLPSCHSQLVCQVEDVDAHYGRALEAGATCVAPSENHGSRMYRALDLEGHRWIFSGS